MFLEASESHEAIKLRFKQVTLEFFSDNPVGGPSSVTTGIKVVSEHSDVSSYSDFSETAIAEISLALATFLNKLEDDNANCVV